MTKKELIEEIKQTMPNIQDNDPDKELKMALYIYIKLGKIKAFDEKYYFGNKETMKQIERLASRAKTNTEEIAKSRRVVCLSISYLYKDILKEFGIEADVIKVDNVDMHVFPVINLKDGRQIQMDIQQDLHNIQTRSRLEHVKSYPEYVAKSVEKISEDKLTQLLIKIGYINEEKDYRNEMIKSLKNEISFLNAQEALTKILEDKRVCEVDNELGYVEATKYYKAILNEMIPQFIDKKVYKTTCYREKQDKSKEYTLCLYAEEKNTIKPFIFYNRRNRFIPTDLEQLNKWEEEGLVIGKGCKKLAKYMRKQKKEKRKTEAMVQE